MTFLSASGKTFSQVLFKKDSVTRAHPALNSPLTFSPGPIKNKVKENTSLLPNSHKIQKLLSVFPHGSVCLGYEYGVLPYVYGKNFPIGGFRTEGDLSVNILKLPLEVKYHYSSIKNIIGLNNYFRVSYDARRYQEQLKNTSGAKKDLLSKQLGAMKTEQKQVAKKIWYYKYLKHNPDYSAPVNPTSDTAGAFKYDSTSYGMNYPAAILVKDTSIDKSTPSKPGYPISDSSGIDKGALSKKNYASGELSKYEAKYDSISSCIEKLNSEMNEIKKYEKYNSAFQNPYLSRAQQFLGNIKKFEIGLCNPNSSAFLINNMPLQGINVEYEKASKFLTIAYGTTVNNLLYNPNSISGILEGTRNYYNYFDFGNLEAGRKVLMIKGGAGSKEGSHLFAGALLGKSKSDYVHSLPDLSSHEKESNLVLEIDGKYNFSPSLSSELVLGKSSISQEEISSDQIKSSLNEIFSNYRSYALLSKTSYSILKSRTNISFTARWVDPYFRSFGVGFIRSDNFRYELKTEQAITNKIKYTGTFRKEEDNLLKLYDYKNTLYSLNNSLNVRVTRNLSIRLIYSPLFRTLQHENYTSTDKNYIATAVLSWLHKSKNLSTQFTSIYSKYILTTDSAKVSFQNFSYSHQLLFNSGFKTGLNITWLKNNLAGTLNNDTYFGIADIGYMSKHDYSFNAGAKAAYKSGIQPQFGFTLKSKIRIYKKLSAELEFSKIIIGDYYSTFDTEKLKAFPYFCKSELSLNF